MLEFIKKYLRSKLKPYLINARLANDKTSILLGTILCDINSLKAPRKTKISDFEFSVFSQFGEDGIIQEIVRRINVKNKVFVEIGTEDYRESNTRFLLMKDKWSGLAIDGDDERIKSIEQWFVDRWKFKINFKSKFLSTTNVNEVIGEFVKGDIGLLSLDIDGNDY